MEWDIQKRSNQCSKCGKEFCDGQEYVTVLLDEEAVQRRDNCLECAPYVDGNIYCSWRGNIKFRPPRPEPVPGDLSERLLRRYISDKDSSKRNICFILAAMLERKKLLVQKKKFKDNEKNITYLIYEHIRTGEIFTIEDPNLSLDYIESVQAEVKEILDQETQVKECNPNKEQTPI